MWGDVEEEDVQPVVGRHQRPGEADVLGIHEQHIWRVDTDDSVGDALGCEPGVIGPDLPGER